MPNTYNVSPSLQSTGNINPSVFVMLDSSNPRSGLQATANARTIGISQVGTLLAPGLPYSTNSYACISGTPIQLFGLGSVCLVTAGSGGFTTGNLLEADSNGNAVVSSVSGHNVGAIALETATASQTGLVQVVMFNHA